MAKRITIPGEEPKKEHHRNVSIQVNFRITPEEDVILWALQTAAGPKERAFRNRSHVIRYYMLLGLKQDGKLDPKVADKMIEAAKFGRYFDNVPVLAESAAASKRTRR